MWGFRRRRAHNSNYGRGITASVSQIAEEVPGIGMKTLEKAPDNAPAVSFAANMAAYIGQTVTIFTKGGGALGSGHTGILAGVTEIYVQLISRLGPAPSCAFFNSCISPCAAANQFKSFICRFDDCSGRGKVYSVGSVTYIPMDKITGFVHSGVQ